MNAQNNSVNNEHVILLHGLGRTPFSLRKLEKALRQQGYQVINYGYPSQRKSIAELAEQVLPESLQACYAVSVPRIHFVTHSLGGILLRYYLKQHHVDRLGHCVMLAPPNQGSELAEKLKNYAWYRYFNGPAGLQLGIGSDSVPLQLGAATFSLGVIAGGSAALWDRHFATLIPGPNDGKVAVERAKLEGMRDFLVVPKNHTTIMDDPTVIAQILHFLKYAHFQR